MTVASPLHGDYRRVGETRRKAKLYEGPTIIDGKVGAKIPTLRRCDTSLFARTASDTVVTPEIGKEAEKNLLLLDAATRVAPELSDILWLYGRTWNADTDRDILLDSTIGLERLLATGSGDTRYRFGLHGRIVIGGTDPEAAESWLKKIYGARSDLAHGSLRNKKELEEIAKMGRQLLGKAIHSLCRFIDDGKLSVQGTKGRIGAAVEQLIPARISPIT